MEPNAMDTQRRTMLAIGISLLLWMLYMTFFAPKPADEQPLALVDGGTPAQVAQPSEPTPAPGAPAVADADGGVVVQSGEAAPEPEAPVQELTRQTEHTIYKLSTEGAGLTQAELQGAKMREQGQVSLAEGFKRLFGGEISTPPQMDMGKAVPGAPKPLSVSILGARPFDANARYRVEEGADGQTLTFTARQGQTEIVKVVQFARTGFEGAMTVTVKNRGGETLQGELGVHYVRGVEPGTEEKASLMGGVGNESHAACSIGDKVHRLVPDQEDSPPTYEGSLEFFGVDQQYFLGALFPLEGERQAKCTLTATPSARTATALFPVNVPAGQETTFKFGLYVGPKLNELLEEVPDRMVNLGLAAPAVRAAGWAALNADSRFPHLDKAIDYGWWAFISRILLVLMRWFETVIPNWGVAIILLTVTVKLILLPLTHKSMVAAENMKKLQPKMEEIRKKFADDKNRQNVEMMKLYQEAKVNPLGGCLPMLVQMPVWIALFTTLRNSYEIYREPFIAPIWMDLTYKDPTYLLPIVLGVTMIITQKLQPQMVDPVQAKMMTYVMPVFFTAIMLNYPAGLSLYILTNNLLSIAQQYGLKKYLAKKSAVPVPARGGK